ncbi:nuclear protein 96-domain-containing protein [Naematelia encephala]|uniref:Nuclear protein 96-domain-containing protein n=1 Tax=Naematelia encephala TaxID=71784 RepID=A0A1Y2AT71_9TREE|nr:nuclear protein 96-domain-containing protein [Naematelia encephala]
MFGQSTGWGQNNQNNQQQQQQQPQQGGGLFGGGGGGGFGQQNNAGGFGQNAGGFGQPAQPNQGGGLFGGGTTNTGFGGGGFGATNQAANTTSTFGARPAFGATGTSTFGGNNTGGGLFGGAPNTGSTFGAGAGSTFGANNNTSGGLFGAKPPGTSTFGSGATSNLFGAKPATTTFGAASTSTNPNQVYQWQPGPYPLPQTNTGSANPLYHPTWQVDQTASGAAATVPHLFHTISAMDPYKGVSHDELRMVDYEQGRKDASATQQQQQQQQTGFGAPAATGFGQPPAMGTFGQPAASTSTFGAPKPGGLFGSTTGTGGFGTGTTGGFGATNNTGGGLFGSTPAQPQTGGLFGQTNTNTGGGLFGQPQQPQTNTGGGLFGNTNPLGQTNPAQPQQPNTSFGFGASTTPAFGAGSTGFGATTGTNTFGQPANNTGTTSFGFGQNNQQQQQQPQQQPAQGEACLEGADSQNTGGGLFGQPAQQQQPAAGGGLFGSTAAKPGGLFGSTTNTTNTGGGLFGQTNNAAQPATGGLFGGTNTAANNTPGTTTSLFGQPQQQNQQQPAAGGGLFGNTSGGGLFGAKPATGTTGGLFGNTQPAQQPAQLGGGLFGNTNNNATGGGLFGSNNNNALGLQNQQNNQAKPAGGLFGGGGGLFGQTNQQQAQQPAPAGGSLFGGLNQSQQPSTSIFGAQQPTQQGLGGSLFGSALGQSSMSQPQQPQPTLTASIDQNPYGNNSLFTYSGQKLDTSTSQKKPALPPLTSSSFRLTPSSKSQISKLRGFASPLSSSQSPARPSSPLNGLGTPARSYSPSVTERYKGLTDAALSPNAFVPRPSIKKLTVNPRAPADDPLESVLGKSALKSSTRSNGTPQATPERFAPSAPTPPLNALTVARPSETSDTPSQRNGYAASAPPVSGSERQPKRGEYWCKPRLDRLKVMEKKALSEIHDFTAGRRGYGEVTFNEPVDLSKVDLDTFLGNVIVFSDMELAVYPDDYPDKPERGQGLNVPATVSLENCFAKDKATKQPIKDTSDPRHARFLKRVKTIPETDFVSWTDDGTWTFKVEHFSRYGLNDDDSDEGMGEAEQLKSKIGTIEEGDEEEDDEDLLPPTKSRFDKNLEKDEEHDSGLEDDVEEEDDEMEAEESEGEHGSPSSSSSASWSYARSPDAKEANPQRRDQEDAWAQPLKAKLGAEGLRKLKEMQSSFFGEKSQHVKLDLRDGHLRRVEAGMRTKRLLTEDTAGFEQPEEEGKQLDRAIKRTSFGYIPKSPKLRQPRKYARVPLEQSLVAGYEGVKADAGLALGRSFRCSWGPNGELVHFGKICKPSDDFTASSESTVVIEKVELLADKIEVERARAERLLSLHLAKSTIDTSEAVPFATISSDIRFRDFAARFDPGDRSHEANIWRLCVALFDEIDLRLPPDSSEDLVLRIGEIRRKLALSKWLEDAVSPSVDSDLLKSSGDQSSKLFAYLSGNQLDRAVADAIEGNDIRLATLISQCGSSEVFREEVLRQLEDWKKYKANSMISPGYRRIYTLLAGITDISPGEPSRGSDQAPDVLVAEGLDWKRAFGLRLWFGNPFDNTIGDVLDSFTTALDSTIPPAKPIPPYLEKPSPLIKEWKMTSLSTDVLYSLIRLYADVTVSLDQVLQSRDVSPSPLDARLSWHMYQMLSRVLKVRDFEDREDGYSPVADAVTSGYAKQLEESGDWLWAAFVLLHLETLDGTKHALKALLHRHADLGEDDERFLVDVLQVPSTWIHEARADSFAEADDAFAEYHELIAAELYDRAQRVLIDKLAPEVVLRKDLDILQRLCAELEDKRPDGWEYRGQLLVDYVNLVTRVPDLLTSVLRAGSVPDPIERASLVNLAKSLPRVIQLLPALFPDKDDVQQVASLSDMLSELHQLAGTLYDAGYVGRLAVGGLLVNVDRLHLLQERAFGDFERTLAGVAV